MPAFCSGTAGRSSVPRRSDWTPKNIWQKELDDDAAGRTHAASCGRHGRHPVADAEPFHPAADGDDLPGVFMAKHVAGRRLERAVPFCQMQVGAANAAAAHLQDHLAGDRIGIRQGFDLQRSSWSYEYCRSHESPFKSDIPT